MSNIKLNTKYAPAERDNKEEINRQVKYFQNNEVLNETLGKIPAVFLIVNKYRQIIYLNKGALEFTGLDDLGSVVGKRPGEIIGCIHSEEESGGCGTSEACTYCGAVNAVLEAQNGRAAVRDCRLLLGNDHNAFDLRIWASPLIFNKEEFTTITLQDISMEKWREFLERIFFHDILNTTTVLKSTLELLINYKNTRNPEKLLNQAEGITNNLIEEIRTQQLLIDAENKKLNISVSTFSSVDILKEIINLYEENNRSIYKTIEIDPSSDLIELNSDRIILRRILVNMIKNALEATPKGGKVTLGCNIIGENIRFWIHNSEYIPRDIQMQIFNRSFSTKGKGRGLGTYSMKLLSSFLEGTVSFTTSKENGTTFNIEHPINLKRY